MYYISAATAFVCFFASYFVEILFSSDCFPAIPVIQVMIIAWGLHAIVKLLNYPILAASFGASWVNTITKYFLLMHVVLFIIWATYFNETFSMSVMFTSVIFIQMIVFIFHFIKNNRNQE